MTKYLLEGSFTAEGAKGTVRDGGTRRRAIVAELAESLGGRLEAMYYAFGDIDVFGIVDLPDAASAAAMSLAISQGGAARLKTVVLMTAEEMDAVGKKSVQYRPPGP
jgi:uncharacterized protein with GYD domain